MCCCCQVRRELFTIGNPLLPKGCLFRDPGPYRDLFDFLGPYFQCFCARKTCLSKMLHYYYVSTVHLSPHSIAALYICISQLFSHDRASPCPWMSLVDIGLLHSTHTSAPMTLMEAIMSRTVMIQKKTSTPIARSFSSVLTCGESFLECSAQGRHFYLF